jgi:hypothetical protein
MTDKRFLTIREASLKVNYTEHQIRQMCIDGKIKAHKLNDKSRKWLIPESEITKVKDMKHLKVREPKTIDDVQEPNNFRINNEHRDHLLEIINLLLENEVGNVMDSPSQGNIPESDDYTIISEESDFTKIPASYLVERIENNIELFCKTYSAYDFWDCFVPHIMAETERNDFNKFYSDHTIEFINLLRILAQRKTLKGSCPICEDW